MQSKKSSKTLNLKDYARLAKKRMGSGYWEQIRQERADYIKNNSDENADKINHLYEKRLMREIYYTANQDKDEELYRKVCNILDKDGYVINPISQLIDHDEFDNMDFASRQTYLIKLTDKYKELRERYDKEREFKRRVCM